MNNLKLNESMERMLRQNSYWATTHMLRTLAWSDKSIHRVFYYNLTYACNSRCVFCASDNLLDTKPSISPDKVIESFDYYNIQIGDTVVLNGGEATLVNSLKKIIDAASNAGACVILFTNGRLLMDIDYAGNLLENVDRVTIPLYSMDGKLHNGLTGSLNGHQETMEGIRNVIFLRDEYKYGLELELKCLTIKPSLDENPIIIDEVHDRFGKPNKFVLAGIIPSKTVLKKADFLIPTWNKLCLSINLTLAQAYKHNFPDVRLPDIPLCALDESIITEYIIRNGFEAIEEQYLKGNKVDQKWFYFDATCMPEGHIFEKVNNQLSNCSQCVLTGICDVDKAFMNLVSPDFCGIPIISFNDLPHLET